MHACSVLHQSLGPRPLAGPTGARDDASVQDREVLIPGGTGGLGVHVTAAFVRAGARVTVPVFSPPETAALREVLGDRFDAVRRVDADLRDEAQVRRLVEGMPKIDALVHLVGGFAMGETQTFALDTLREQLELNVVTAFATIKHALARMRELDYGRIVTVASRAAEQPSSGLAAYAAAKAGVLALTRAVADETRGTDITANCVLASVIDTPANRAAMGISQLHRWVAPQNLAEHIVHLASDAAGTLRGTALRVYADA
jgi:NAD(P)-dependent dehydrogenase (short-subunit alcohol dehydrogenase family)